MMILSLLLTVFSSFAQSQSTTTPPPTTTPAPAESKEASTENVGNKQMAKITVTGSYIKRVDEEGPSAVQTIDTEQIKKSGANSVGDVLRNNAVISAVGRESSGSSTAGTSTATMRAFGSDSILVLLNGLRLPKIGGGNSVDLNLIPVSALERVEVLKDGASALYGSDAVGGVINFITKKDYNQSDVRINYSLPQELGGNKFDVVGSTGYSTEKYAIMGVLQYRNNRGIYDRDRSFSKMQNITTDGNNFGSPGTFAQTSNAQKIFGPEGCSTVNEQGYCAYDTTKQSMGLPDLQQFSGMLSGRYNITPKLKLISTHVLNRKDVFWQYAPAPDRLTTTQAQATGWGLAGVTGDGFTFYRLVEELGPRKNNNVTTSYTGQIALEGKINSWDWELSGTFGQSTISQTGTSGYANKQVLYSLISTGGFNPFAPSGTKSDISSAVFQPTQDITNTQASTRFVTTGSLYGGGKYFGPIGMAVGGSSEWQSYKERVDAITGSRDSKGLSNLFGGSGSNGDGRRNFQALFTEISMFPINSVEVALAARYDKFSDFGNTVNPKLSASWQANDKFLLRSSIGTGFRAPDLGTLYAGESFGFPTFVDRKGCADGVSGACKARQYQFNTRGNRNLKQETSVFYNLGFVTQPKKNWRISVDGWAANIKDIAGLSLADITLMETRLPGGKADLESRYNIKIDRDSQGRLLSVDALTLNLGTRTVSGFDVGITHEGHVNAFGKGLVLRSSFDHTQFLRNYSETFPGIGIRSNRDIFWKNTLSFNVIQDKNNFGIMARSIAGGDKSANEGKVGDTGYGSLPFYTEYDLTYSRMDLWKNGTLSVILRNAFNSSRPLDDSVPVPSRLATSIYDPVGRAIQIGYGFSF